MLLAVLFLVPAVPSAFADTTVSNLRIDSGNVPNTLYVDEGTYTLKLWATVPTTSSEINVSSEATWTSTNPAAIKVDRGVLTVLSASDSVTILAKYNNSTTTIDLKSKYHYKEVYLQDKGQGTKADAAADVALNRTLEYDLLAVDADTTAETTAKDLAVWDSSNTAVATVSKGVVTLKAEGQTTITASYGGRSDSVVLTVKSPYKSISISPEGFQEMTVGGETIPLQAEGNLTTGGTPDPLTQTADWKSSNENVVQVDKGIVSAVGPGIATVTAQQYGQSDNVTIIVRTPYEGIRIVPDKRIQMPLQAGPTELTLWVMNSETSQQDVSVDNATVWVVANPEIAIVKEEGGKANVYPRLPGTTKIKGTYKGLSKEITLTVFPTISSISLAKDELNVFTTDAITLPAVSGVTLSGDTEDVSAMAQWESKDTAILNFENGKWVIKGPGTVNLEAKVMNKPDGTSTKSATLKVTIVKKPLTLISENDDLSVILGKSTPLPKVTVWYDDGKSEEVSGDVTWQSSTTKIVVVDGVITGISAGRSVLTGTYSGKTVKVNVTTEEEYTSLTIDPKVLDLTVGSSKSIKVTGKTAKGKSISLGSRLDWKSSNEDLTDIKTSTVKAAGEGSGKLTAVFQGKTLTLNFTFKPKLNKLTVSDRAIDGTVGGAPIVLKLEAEYNTGKTVDVTTAAVWTTANSKIATVSAGVIKPVGKGMTTIKGTFGGKFVSIRISVK